MLWWSALRFDFLVSFSLHLVIHTNLSLEGDRNGHGRVPGNHILAPWPWVWAQFDRHVFSETPTQYYDLDDRNEKFSSGCDS